MKKYNFKHYFQNRFDIFEKSFLIFFYNWMFESSLPMMPQKLKFPMIKMNTIVKQQFMSSLALPTDLIHL